MELVGQASGVQEYSYDYDDESYEYSDYMDDDEDNTEEDEEYYNYIDEEENDYPEEDARDGKASAQHANIFSLPVQQPRSIFQLPRCHVHCILLSCFNVLYSGSPNPCPESLKYSPLPSSLQLQCCPDPRTSLGNFYVDMYIIIHNI